MVVGSIVLACAPGCGNDNGGDTTAPTTAVPAADPALVAFAQEADAVCAQFAPRFEELSDPDGDGGHKPVGLGQLVEEMFAELGRVRPPSEHVAGWDEAIGLLIESGRVLTEAEDLAAAGDEAASDAAQSRALFELQPSGGELVDQINAPFEVCFAD